MDVAVDNTCTWVNRATQCTIVLLKPRLVAYARTAPKVNINRRVVILLRLLWSYRWTVAGLRAPPELNSALIIALPGPILTTPGRGTGSAAHAQNALLAFTCGKCLTRSRPRGRIAIPVPVVSLGRTTLRGLPTAVWSSAKVIVAPAIWAAVADSMRLARCCARLNLWTKHLHAACVRTALQGFTRPWALAPKSGPRHAFRRVLPQHLLRVILPTGVGDCAFDAPRIGSSPTLGSKAVLRHVLQHIIVQIRATKEPQQFHAQLVNTAT